jgi:hypothetical protein
MVTTNPRRTLATDDDERRLLRWQQLQTERAATPIDPADDPVIRRGRHNIAEVGQPENSQGDRQAE